MARVASRCFFGSDIEISPSRWLAPGAARPVLNVKVTPKTQRPGRLCPGRLNLLSMSTSRRDQHKRPRRCIHMHMAMGAKVIAIDITISQNNNRNLEPCLPDWTPRTTRSGLLRDHVE